MVNSLEKFEGKQCRVIEVAHSVYNRDVFIDLYDELGEWLDNQPDVDLYSSFFRYYTDDPYVGPVLAGFGMDFDCHEKPRKAQKEALSVCKYLIDKFDVSERDLSICFSGNKGFHVFVNHSALGVEPHYHLPKIYKEMARELTETLGLKTLDLQIYDRRRLIRLPNSRHQKTQLYKIHLTLNELEILSVDKIKSQATTKREWVHVDDHEVSEKMHRWYVQHRDQYLKKLKEKKERFSDQDFTIKRVLPCVEKRLEKGAEEGSRNRCTWQLASYFCQRGTPLDECLNIMERWHDKLDPGLHPYSWSVCEKTIRSTYENGGYHIGCSSDYVTDLCVGKENCPLFVQMEETSLPPGIYNKAEEKLEQNPLEYIKEAVQEIHTGDSELIQIAYISALSPKLGRVSINLWPIGTSQKGKSHVLKSTLNVLPVEQYETFTSASPKSLFYYVKKYGEEAFDGKLLYIDEIETSRLTIPMLRSLTSQTAIQPRHLSVNDAELLDLKIKGKRAVWFTSVKPFGEDQIRNRFIFVNPDETKKQDYKVFQLQDEIYRQGEQPEQHKFQIAQALTQRILEDTEHLNVKIPYRIEWPYKSMRWLYPFFLSFLQVITKINYKKRQKQNSQITATQEDFQIAKQLWEEFIEHIIYRISQPAKTVFDRIPNKEVEAKSRSELGTETGYSTRHIKRKTEELEEANLVNKKKREEGHHAWLYWKAKIPSTENIKCKVEHGETHDKKTQVESGEKQEIMERDPRETVSSCHTFLYKHTPSDESCELCGEQPVEYVIFDEDTKLRRCQECFQEMQNGFPESEWQEVKT